MWPAAIAIALALWAPPPTAYHVRDLPTTTDPITGESVQILGMEACYPEGWCEVWINGQRWTWRMLCTTIVHETGHATGLPDLYDPMDRENVMYYRVARTADACRGRRPSGYRRAAKITLTPDPDYTPRTASVRVRTILGRVPADDPVHDADDSRADGAHRRRARGHG